MIAPEYFNNHIAVEGEIIVKRVPNDTGSVMVWNPTTKKISIRTHSEIISDLSLMTTNTDQMITGKKAFVTSGGNYAPFNNTLQIYADDGSLPSMTYSKGGSHVGQIMFNSDGFYFKNGDNNAYYNIKAKGFIKENGDNSKVLLDGGGSKPISEFVSTNHTHTSLENNQNNDTVDSHTLLEDNEFKFVHRISAGSPNLFPTINNANSIIAIASHPGKYGTLLGVNGDGDWFSKNVVAGGYQAQWRQFAYKEWVSTQLAPLSSQLHDRIPYTGAIQNPDFNGKNLNNINRLNTNGSIKHNGLGLSLVNISGSGGYNSVLIKTGLTSGNMGTFTVKLYHYAHEYLEFNVSNYKYQNSNYLPQITWKAGNSKAITRIEFLKNSNNDLYVNIVMYMAYPRLAVTDLMVYGWDDVPFDSANWTAEFNGSISGLNNEGQLLPGNFLRDSYLDDLYLSSAQQVWKKHPFALHNAVKTDKPFSVLTEGEAEQKIVTGGVYAGNNYSEISLVPEHGGYFKGLIDAKEGIAKILYTGFGNPNYRKNPAFFSYWGGLTGAIVIELPGEFPVYQGYFKLKLANAQWNNLYQHLEIQTYSGGSDYSNALITNDTDNPNLVSNIRLGNTPSGKGCIIINNVDTDWYYPFISVDEYVGGSAECANGKWNAYIVTNLTDYTLYNPTIKTAINKSYLNNSLSKYFRANEQRTVAEVNDMSLPQGNYKLDSQNFENLPGTFTSLINLGQYTGGGYSQQLAVPFANGIYRGLWLRTSKDSTWDIFHKMWDDTDFTNTDVQNWKNNANSIVIANEQDPNDLFAKENKFGWINGAMTGAGGINSWVGNYLSIGGNNNGHKSQLLISKNQLLFRGNHGNEDTAFNEVYHSGNVGKFIFGDNGTGTINAYDISGWTHPVKSGFYRPNSLNDWGSLLMWAEHPQTGTGTYGAGIAFDYAGTEAYLTGIHSDGSKEPNKKIWTSGNLNKNEFVNLESGKSSISISDTDLNDLLQTGFFKGSNLGHSPTGTAEWFFVTNEYHNTGWISQTATSYGTGAAGAEANRIFKRAFVSGSYWTDWYEVYTSFNLNPATFVSQSSLNTQLSAFATLAGVQTFQNTNIFAQSPIVPNGTLGTHAVNLDQLLSVALPFQWNWSGSQAILDRRVIGELAWKNFGNGHTIFDASSSLSPWGASISNTDAQIPWSPSYPTLMGGNGSETFGVRVDSARVADSIQGHTVSDITKAGGINLFPNSSNFKLGGSDYSNSDNSVLGQITVSGTGNWNAYATSAIKEYTPVVYLTFQIEVLHNDTEPRDFTQYFYYSGGNLATVQTAVPPNVWTKIYTSGKTNGIGGVLVGLASSGMQSGTIVKYRNIQVEESRVASTYRPALEDNNINDYWKIHDLAAFRGINTNKPFAILNNGEAQKVYTNGLLVSNFYQDEGLVPTNGIYSKGDILTSGTLLIGSNVPGFRRVLHLAEPTFTDSYGFNFYTDSGTGLLSLYGLNNGSTNSNPILSANRSNNFIGINRGNPTSELDVNGTISTSSHGTSEQWQNVYQYALMNRGRVFSSNVDANNISVNTEIVSIELPNGSGNTNFPFNNYGTFMRMQSNTFVTDFAHENNGKLWFRNWYIPATANGSVWRHAWDSENFNPSQYVLQSSLNSQLGNYATLHAVQTFTNTNTFSQSPVIPNGTLGTHAVNKNQIELSATPESEGGQQLNISGNNSVNLTNYFVTSRDGSRNPDDIAPNSTPKRVRFDFANSTSAGLGATGNYAGIMTFAPWDGTSASTGDSSYQLAFANQSGVNGSGVPMLKIRKGIDGKWGKAWYKFWTDADFNNTNIQQWNYAYQYGLKLNQEFTTNSNTGLMLADNYFGGESGMVDSQQQAFVAGKTGEYYKYGSSIFGGLEGINYHLKSKNVGIGGEADPDNKVRVEGCVKATENFKSKDEQADTMFIPNGNLATLRDEIVNDESDYAIRLDPHEYEFDPSGYIEVDDRNRLIHIIGEQTKMVVNFREIYPKQQIVIYNFDKSGGSMAVQVYGKTIYNIEPGFFLRLYVTKSRRVIAERQQPSDFIW